MRYALYVLLFLCFQLTPSFSHAQTLYEGAKGYEDHDEACEKSRTIIATLSGRRLTIYDMGGRNVRRQWRWKGYQCGEVDGSCSEYDLDKTIPRLSTDADGELKRANGEIFGEFNIGTCGKGWIYLRRWSPSPDGYNDTDTRVRRYRRYYRRHKSGNR